MSLTEYADLVAQNLGWLIAIGVAVCLFLFFTFTVSRRLFHIQKELGQLSEDVAALRLAEGQALFHRVKAGSERAERQEPRLMSARDAPHLVADE